jgi:hypothetical protein
MWFNNMRLKYGNYCILGIITFILLVFGSILWCYHYLQGFAVLPNPQQISPSATSPIDLAEVTATLGGLVLVGAFYRERATDKKEQSNDLKLIGKLILLSSACFLIFFFGMEYVRSVKDSSLNIVQQLYIWATAATVANAAVSTSVALSVLVIIVRFL